MKTNQYMTVPLSTFGTLHIWHKDGIGKVSDILAIGNQYRASVGATPITSLQSYLRKPSTWRTIIAIHNKMVEDYDHLVKLDMKETMENLPKVERKKANRDRHGLGKDGEKAKCSANSLEKDSKNPNSVAHGLGKHRIEIDYAKILKTKQFSHIIKSQRGGNIENRGYWGDLYLLIDIAMMMNEEFKVDMIDVFVKRQLLIVRNNGGNEFKKLNALIAPLPNKSINPYKDIAKLVNAKVNGSFSKGWNGEDKDLKAQTYREELLKKLCSFIEMGFVTSYPQLKDTINKL